MIKSKIFYGLCITALGLSFAEAMNGGEWPALTYTYKKPNPQDKQPTKKTIYYPTNVIKRPNNSLNNNDRNQLTNALNSYAKNLQVTNIRKSVYDLTKDLRSELTKNAQKATISDTYVKKYIEESINLLTYLMICGGTYNEIKETLKKIFVQSTAEKYTQFMYEQILKNVRSYNLLFLYTRLSDLLTKQNKEFIRKEVCGYEIIKKKAKELLDAIGDPSYNKNAKENLEKELQALGGCRRNKWINHGDDFLKIQLEAILNPNEYEYWPRNDYNELVWNAICSDWLTVKEKEALEYLISVGGNGSEIAATFKNVFMRTLENETVNRHRRSKKSSKEATCKGVLYKKSFNETANSLDLTDSEKNVY